MSANQTLLDPGVVVQTDTRRTAGHREPVRLRVTRRPHEEAMGHCVNCGKRAVLRRTAPRHTRHLAIAIITVGLWVPVWATLSLLMRRWRCARCHSVARRD